MSLNRFSNIEETYIQLLDRLTELLVPKPAAPQLDENKAIIFRDILSQLREIFSDVTSVKDNPIIFLEFNDIIISTTEIVSIIEEFKREPEEFEWRRLTADFLKRRADRILNGPLCYTVNRVYLMNDVCISLARLCDPEHVCSLLMPAIAKEDIYGNEFDELAIGQFILSDDKLSFINLADVVETAFSRSLESEQQVFLTTTSEGRSRPLSSDEISRMGTISQELDNITKQFKNTNFFTRLMASNKLYDELVALRGGLKEGDVRHGGAEMNAGVAANVAIVRFREYYESLSRSAKIKLESLSNDDGNTMRQVLERLFRNPAEARQNNGTSVIYCLYLVGSQLDSIISQNRHQLLSISETKQECIDRLKRELMQKIMRKRYNNINSKSFPSLTLQLVELIDYFDVIAASISSYSSEANLLHCMIKFIAAECLRFIKEDSFNEKLNGYANLLFAIGTELTLLEKRSEDDVRLVLNEAFKRISILSSCSQAFIYFSKPSSELNWMRWIQDNPILQQYPFHSYDNADFCYVNHYQSAYPPLRQRMLTTQAITRLRSEQEAERVAAINAVKQQQHLQNMRQNSPLSFFYRHPEAVGFAIGAVSTVALVYGMSD